MKITLLLLLSIAGLNAFCQIKDDSTFLRIASQVEKYRMDTTLPPNDKSTKLIVQLRQVKGGFNINEAINFKMQEDKQKNELTTEQYNKLQQYFETGEGKRKLDNAVIWIYRNYFNSKELKQLVKFYKTPAGKKLSANFPVIMLQSLMAAQALKDELTPEKK